MKTAQEIVNKIEAERAEEVNKYVDEISQRMYGESRYYVETYIPTNIYYDVKKALQGFGFTVKDYGAYTSVEINMNKIH